MRTLTLSAVLALILAACTGTPPAPPAEPEKPAEPEAPAVSVAIGQDDGGEYPEVVIESKGDEMAYNVAEITIKANTKTRIRMQNNATMDAMKHNVVIVQKGTTDKVGQAGMSVPLDKHHVPMIPEVLAATEVAGPGESKTVVVELAAGEYEFVCTFPGHYVLMKGVVKVIE